MYDKAVCAVFFSALDERRISPGFRRTLNPVEVIFLSHSHSDENPPVLRLEPEKRLCPLYDPDSIAKYHVADPDEMGFRVLDNFCEEHIQ